MTFEKLYRALFFSGVADTPIGRIRPFSKDGVIAYIIDINNDIVKHNMKRLNLQSVVTNAIRL
jgi:N-acyl-L-homoserine lactone synthetase